MDHLDESYNNTYKHQANASSNFIYEQQNAANSAPSPSFTYDFNYDDFDLDQYCSTEFTPDAIIENECTVPSCSSDDISIVENLSFDTQELFDLTPTNITDQDKFEFEEFLRTNEASQVVSVSEISEDLTILEAPPQPRIENVRKKPRKKYEELYLKKKQDKKQDKKTKNGLIFSNWFILLKQSCPRKIFNQKICLNQNKEIVEKIILILENIYTVFFNDDIYSSYPNLKKNINNVEETNNSINTIIESLNEKDLNLCCPDIEIISKKDFIDLYNIIIEIKFENRDFNTLVDNCAKKLLQKTLSINLLPILINEIKTNYREIAERKTIILLTFLKYPKIDQTMDESLKLFISRIIILFNFIKIMEREHLKDIQREAFKDRLDKNITRALIKYIYHEKFPTVEVKIQLYNNYRKNIIEEFEKNPGLRSPVQPTDIIIFDVIGIKMDKLSDYFITSVSKLTKTEDHQCEFVKMAFSYLVKSIYHIYDLGDILTE
ncbi:hypothetical protein NGRA_0207 [Nosema granulosis]|uniref:Uncharacterized protein n=1 Tax=Nosema granulosis TaxID=83296 RepID=A0A9P6H1D6_9MICR|nr:hypothetical protein NGRA_0207 [Nosema granulosis]